MLDRQLDFTYDRTGKDHYPQSAGAELQLRDHRQGQGRYRGHRQELQPEEWPCWKPQGGIQRQSSVSPSLAHLLQTLLQADRPEGEGEASDLLPRRVPGNMVNSHLRLSKS